MFTKLFWLKINSMFSNLNRWIRGSDQFLYLAISLDWYTWRSPSFSSSSSLQVTRFFNRSTRWSILNYNISTRWSVSKSNRRTVHSSERSVWQSSSSSYISTFPQKFLLTNNSKVSKVIRQLDLMASKFFRQITKACLNGKKKSNGSNPYSATLPDYQLTGEHRLQLHSPYDNSTRCRETHANQHEICITYF